MAPSIGRIVLVKFHDRTINGVSEFPAIVTAIHTETMINCRVFTESEAAPLWATSVPHQKSVPKGYSGPTWRWPPKGGK